MAKVFVSYASAHRPKVAELADDVASLGHTAWFDRELTGGQAWWDQILARIRECDAFVLVLTDETLASEACRRELAYAQALSRPLLPLRLDLPVDMHLVPPEVSQRQIVDYGAGDKSGALNLNRALQALEPAGPLPDPLPEPPPVPISYVAEIIEEIRRKDELSYDEQVAIVFRLRDHLDEQARDLAGVRKAYETLLARRELYAKVRDEIHQILAQAGAPLPPPPTTQGTRGGAARVPMTAAPAAKDRRGLGCLLGGVSLVLPFVGLILFFTMMSTRPRAATEALIWGAVGMALGCFCGLPLLQAVIDANSYQPYPPMYPGF